MLVHVRQLGTAALPWPGAQYVEVERRQTLTAETGRSLGALGDVDRAGALRSGVGFSFDGDAVMSVGQRHEGPGAPRPAQPRPSDPMQQVDVLESPFPVVVAVAVHADEIVDR